MVVTRDAIFDNGWVHENNGPKHVWCVTAAWLQMTSISIAVIIQTHHSLMMFYSAKSKLPIVHKKHIIFALSLSLLFLIVCTGQAIPTVTAVLLGYDLPDVSSLCSFFHLNKATSPVWMESVVWVYLAFNMACVLLVIGFNAKVQMIKFAVMQSLAKFNVSVKGKMLVPWRQYLWGAASILSHSVAMGVLLYGPTPVTMAGGWPMMVFSLPTLLHALNQVTMTVSNKSSK